MAPNRSPGAAIAVAAGSMPGLRCIIAFKRLAVSFDLPSRLAICSANLQRVKMLALLARLVSAAGRLSCVIQ
jgi:hypothetical protein